MADRAIVVGVDLEEPGDGAIRAALRRFGEQRDVRVLFVFAVDASALPEAFDDREFESEADLLEAARGLITQRIERVAHRLGQDAGGLRFHVECAAGKAVPTLLAMCERHEPELLIVGTHGRRGFERFVLGSVAETLVREAPCDVLVARAMQPPLSRADS